MNTNEIIEKAKERLAEIEAEAVKLRALVKEDEAAKLARRRDTVQRILGNRTFFEIYASNPSTNALDIDAVNTDIQLAFSVVESFNVGVRVMADDAPRYDQAIKDAKAAVACAFAYMRHPEYVRTYGGDITKTPWYQMGILIVTNAVAGARKGCAVSP